MQLIRSVSDELYRGGEPVSINTFHLSLTLAEDTNVAMRILEKKGGRAWELGLSETRKLINAAVNKQTKGKKEEVAIAVIVYTSDDSLPKALSRVCMDKLFSINRRFFMKGRIGEPVWWLWQDGHHPFPMAWTQNEGYMLFKDMLEEYKYPWVT